MKIKIGEYVRTEDGYIGKLVEYIPNALNYLKIFVNREIRHSDNTIDKYIYTRYGFSLKHSYNIIDLIEVDDYVNGHKVIFDTNETEEEQCNGIYRKCIVISTSKNDDSGWKLIDLEIESIVTKEQFEQNCYKLKE